MSKTITQGIEISVLPAWLPERSNPNQDEYFFLYQIQIHNRSEHTVQLINRHWSIIDGDKPPQEVNGPGVVGKQPLLSPGESFEYTSGCPLTTPKGSMEGWFEMAGVETGSFNAVVDRFELNAELRQH